MDAQSATAAIPTRRGDGFLRVVSNSEIDSRQKEVANKEAAQKLQNKPPIMRLAAYIRTAWQANLMYIPDTTTYIKFIKRVNLEHSKRDILKRDVYGGTLGAFDKGFLM